MEQVKLFEALRRAPVQTQAVGAAPNEVLFQLIPGESGCLLRVIDRKGVEAVVDYRAFSGVERDVLKAYEEIRWAWDESRLWSEEGEAETGVLLHEHSHLVWLLSRCKNTVNARMDPLTFNESPMRLQLELNSDDAGWMRGRLRLLDSDGAPLTLERPQMVAEAHVLDGTTVYAIPPLGTAFKSIVLFADAVSIGQLNEYLTLFFSSFPTVEIDYSGYAVCIGEPLAARPALVFQQVDENAALHVEVAQSVPGFTLEFARDYDLGRVAFIDEMEALIRVREVHYGDVLASRKALLKRLNKICRSLKTAEAYLIDDEEGLVLGPDLASEFLRAHLAEIVGEFELYGAEKLKAYRIRHVQPREIFGSLAAL